MFVFISVSPIFDSWPDFTLRVLGTVHFLRGRGAGGFGGGGGFTQKKNGLKGGPSQKTEGRGGHAKYFSSCRVDMMFYY